VPPGQAKYVYCAAGAVLDVVVDVREGSPTFGTHDSVLLDAETPRAVYLTEGLGHAFLSLADASSVTYLVSTTYNPEREFGIHALDPELALPWPADVPIELSAKDAAAPTLQEARARGQLPTMAACAAWTQRSRDRPAAR
jgi:dTDP-4-dehydrorhamnose 3,5-epimerase